METAKKFYSQKAITIATFFGGPIAAGILIKRNCLNQGKTDQGRNALFIGIISTTLLFAGIFAIPENIIEKIPNAVIPAIYTGLIYWIVEKIQGKELKEHKEKGGEFYSGWKAAGVGTLSLGFIFLGVAVSLFLAGDFSNTMSEKEAAAYDLEVEIFTENEDKALAVFSIIENAKPDYLVEEFTKGSLLWKENRAIIEKLQTYENLPEELVIQNQNLLNYCDLRIQHTELIVKAISEDTDKYDQQLESISMKIEEALENLNN